MRNLFTISDSILFIAKEHAMPLSTHIVSLPYIEIAELLHKKYITILDDLLHDPLSLSQSEISKILSKLAPDSIYLRCDLYDHLIQNLTPKHFLTEKKFNKYKNTLYHCDCHESSCKHDELFYLNPNNLSPIGIMSVFVELKKIEIDYINKFAEVKHPLTKEHSHYLIKSDFILFYIATQSYGYKILNSLLWDPKVNQENPQYHDLIINSFIIFKAESQHLKSPLYEYLKIHLTPQHFLTDKKFDEQKDILYSCTSHTQTCSHTPDFYENPDNLSLLGRLRVLIELKRIEAVYLHEFSIITNRLTGKEEQFLQVNQYLAIYLYTTNLGYKKINQLLRQNVATKPCVVESHHSETSFKFGDFSCTEIITFINNGLNRLNAFPKYRLDLEQHKLIRFMSLSEELMRNIVISAIQMNAYLDKAFLSTSFNSEGAAGFAVDHNFKLIIATYGHNIRGAKINRISALSEEDEFLLTPGVVLHCHSDHPITYDERTKVCTVHVCAINLLTIARTALITHKYKDLFMRSILKKRAEKLAATNREINPESDDIPAIAILDSTLNPANPSSTSATAPDVIQAPSTSIENPTTPESLKLTESEQVLLPTITSMSRRALIVNSQPLSHDGKRRHSTPILGNSSFMDTSVSYSKETEIKSKQSKKATSRSLFRADSSFSPAPILPLIIGIGAKKQR
jgi:hypothetical protein